MGCEASEAPSHAARALSCCSLNWLNSQSSLAIKCDSKHHKLKVPLSGWDLANI